MNAALQFVNRLGLARVAAMAVVAVLMLGFFAVLIMRASTPMMAPLYSGLSLEDSNAIVEELRGAGVPFELRGEGDTIAIPRDQITTWRMTLAGSGLPRSGQVGYEIFDQQSSLGATSFVQNINNVRALEGELARTITSLNRIRTARVHLVLPERELFRRERKDPSASIALGVRGELTSGEIRAIQHLVASAIEGMSPMRVSIVDDNGRLLASGSGEDTPGMAGSQMEERVLGVETRLRTRVEELLADVVGANRARVQVSAELDLNRLTRTAETFDPDGQVVRSTQTREVVNSSTGPGRTGEVSVANQLPGANASNSGGGNAEQGSTTEETVNYEISRTTQTETTEAGGIKRVSVAVVVDGIYADDGAGGTAWRPRTPDEIAQLTALVRSAVGFDSTRGDTVEVVNMQFAERAGATGPGTAAADTLFDFTRDDLMKGAEMLVTLIIALALVLFVMRPLLRRVMTPETPLALSPTAAVGGPGLPVPANGAASETAGEGASQVRVPDWVTNARSAGEAQAKTVKTVGTLIEENPKQAALIVRDWLGNAA
ncbi:flagellar M-ring protein FliF [Devosia enhydra]|uniref:Flagellar M-ring protein n=1 Tax=Devosia enhydra TaxID=665118 RepID=A0A1K2HWN1_9HYPH|nr:flagellar basal-body MS-ring/collar protein FliF [Devosia enhydra]SFZ83498.1 flagellar M-ring protein FliF [Devosia enhydra]